MNVNKFVFPGKPRPNAPFVASTAHVVRVSCCQTENFSGPS